MTKTYTVYKYVDTRNDEIVYIGLTDREMSLRINEHSREVKFRPFLNHTKVYYFTVKNRAEMRIFEKLLINKYSPVLNDSDKYLETMDIVFAEPTWYAYEDYLLTKNDLKNQIATNPKKKQKRRRINHAEENKHTFELIDYIISEISKNPDITEILVPKHLTRIRTSHCFYFTVGNCHISATLPLTSIIDEKNESEIILLPTNALQQLNHIKYNDKVQYD